MATFSLVHGAWHGGWCGDQVRAELEARGHVVHTPDLPGEDVGAGIEEYAARVPRTSCRRLGAVHSPMLECPRELAALLDALV